MSCAADAVRQIFKKSYTPWPRSDKFRKLEDLLWLEELPATKYAKILCLFLRKLKSHQSPHSRKEYGFVFLHPNSKARGYNKHPHCLGLLYDGMDMNRFCAWEDNWRKVYDSRNGFKFQTRDWMTALPNKYMDKPFKFSYFITETGYSLFVTPKKVLNGINYDYKHEYSYSNDWEKEF